jgi:hypothetical protein
MRRFRFLVVALLDFALFPDALLALEAGLCVEEDL